MGNAFFSAGFSVYDDQAVFAFSFDSIIYKITDRKVSPVIRLDIKSTKDLFYKKNSVVSSKGFIGHYLFVNYEMKAVSGNSDTNIGYLYLEDLNNGKIYHTKTSWPIYDDIYYTGYCRISNPLNNKKGYFFHKREGGCG